MYYVYLLKDTSGKIYIGYSSDLRRRISDHLAGKVYWTRRMDKFRLLYYEAYIDDQSAKNRERQLKKRTSAYQGLIKRIAFK